MSKIYAISCSQDLVSMALDRIRTSVEGLDESEISLDWTKVHLVPIVADEKMSFNEGESNIVSIKPITISAYAMVFNSFYGANGMGFSSCIGSLEFKNYFEERVANKSMFHSRIKASILPGDLLGQVMIVKGKK
ncbi:MAG: hypothetical protein ACFFED_12105 [Candidatus Thorarchaeota archaeon]